MVYYILIKRIGSKKYIGVIPGKKGASKVQISKRIRKNLKKGYTYRIITPRQLKLFLSRKKKPQTTVNSPSRNTRSLKSKRRKRR